MNLTRKILSIFNRKDKIKFFVLFALIFVQVLFEVLGVASILPFMQLMSDPSAIQSQPFLGAVYDFFGFETERSMLIWTGAAIIGLLILTNGLSFITLWLKLKYSWYTAHLLSMRLLRSVLLKPYQFFLNNNSSEIMTLVISETNVICSGVLVPLIELVSRAMISIILFVMLLAVDVKISIIMFATLGGAYGLLFLSRQKYLKALGEIRLSTNTMRFHHIQELFAGIKTIKVFNKEPLFYNRYYGASAAFTDIQPKYSIIMQGPSYILQVVAFGAVISLTMFIYLRDGNITSSLPKLTLYAFAGYRLLPSLQAVFAAAAKLRHNIPVFDKTYDALVTSRNFRDEALTSELDHLGLRESIELRDVDFRYEKADHNILNGMNLKIKKGDKVAFVGSTGSGKTTIVDIITGLHIPSGGQLMIDGHPIDDTNRDQWQNDIAYVPQEVFLFDDSILHNLTFGLDEEDIDMKRLEWACTVADIHDFVQESLPDRYETQIGEKGVRLSGGQRQRLGLARAIYHQPNLLILDEATSAVDRVTESNIIDAIKKMPDDLTVISIAHRLSTVRDADVIYILQDGVIDAQGTYDELVKSNEKFQYLAEIS